MVAYLYFDSKGREVTIYDDSVSTRGKNVLEFVSPVSVHFSLAGKVYDSPNEVREKDYEFLEMKAVREIHGKLVQGNLRIPRDFSCKSGSQMDEFHNIKISNCKRKLGKKGDKYYLKVKITATALGYKHASKKDIDDANPDYLVAQVLDYKTPNPRKDKHYKDLPKFMRRKSRVMQAIDKILDSPEDDEEMFHQTETRRQEFFKSGLTTRGEHPQIKYLDTEREL